MDRFCFDFVIETSEKLSSNVIAPKALRARWSLRDETFFVEVPLYGTPYNGAISFFGSLKEIVPLFGFRSCGIQKGGTSSLRSSSQRDPLGAMTFSEVSHISEYHRAIYFCVPCLTWIVCCSLEFTETINSNGLFAITCISAASPTLLRFWQIRVAVTLPNFKRSIP